MQDQRIIKIIQLLHGKSKSGEIHWTETSDDYAFSTSFVSNSIEIKQQYDHDAEEYDYILTIYNSDGRVVSQNIDNDLNRDFPNDEVFRLMRETFESARNDALGIAEALDSILGELEGGF